VAKPALGRGLGSLLGADKIGGKPGGAPAAAAVPAPAIVGTPAPGRGVGTLLAGKVQTPGGTLSVPAAIPAQAQPAPKTERPRLKYVGPREAGSFAPLKPETIPARILRPQWRYLGADLVLLLLAGLVVASRSAPLDWAHVLLLAILVGGGAILGCRSFLEGLKKQESSSASSTLSKWVLAHGPNPGECFVVHLEEPNFVARVNNVSGKRILVPMSPSVWIPIPRRVSDRLKREALAFFESERTKPDTVRF
jgi:hypothetical protein